VALTHNYQMRKQYRPQPWLPLRLKEIEKTQTAIADAMFGGRTATLTEIIDGARKIALDELPILADLVDLPEPVVYELVTGRRMPIAPPAKIAIAGYIGAGDQVFPVDDYMKGAGLAEVVCPEGVDPQNAVAAIVRGDSMFPLEDGSVVVWGAHGGPADAVGRVCAVQVAHDGPLLVKGLRLAPQPGRYNLISRNAPLLENVELEWVAPILAFLPPSAVRTSSDS